MYYRSKEEIYSPFDNNEVENLKIEKFNVKELKVIDVEKSDISIET